MQIISPRQDEPSLIRQAVKVLKKGGVVIYPTETCYGIGVGATNHNAVEKLIKYKGDRKNKPISVAVCDKEMAKEYIEFNPAAENIFDNFLPGPITVICRGKHKVDAKLESEQGTLGLRYPKHDLALKIIRAFGKPITSTSANVSNGKTPYEIADILNNISAKKKELIDLIIDAGRLSYHPPSTIVDTTLNDPQVLRQGEFVFDDKKATTFVSNSVEETINIAQKILSTADRPLTTTSLVFALQGELGAGKTQFAKGVARGLEIKENVKSPTFILCAEYPFHNGFLFHIDTWRMQNESELREIGFEKMLHPGNVIVIEWGQKVFAVLKKIEKRKDVKVVWVKIEPMGENRRKILC